MTTLEKLKLIIFAATLSLSGQVAAQLDGPKILMEDAGNYFLDSPDSTKWAVIITGPTVGETNQAQFRQWSFSLHDILARDYGYSSDTITLLYDRGAPALPGGDRVDGAADKTGIEQALAELGTKVSTGDQITLYLIGHGSGAEEEAKFNIVGPDITGVEFSQLLDQFDQQDIVIVNTTSASYGFSTSLSSEGRVVISSTRSPSERFDPVFSRYFIEALDSRNGDRDKNNRVSMLEAFEYAKSNVEAWYEEQGRLASEHAGLDDNGDALFALNPTIDASDGRLAEIAYIDTLVDDSANLSPAARDLKAQMQETERAVFILRGRKQDFLEADYWQQMQGLLVDLARVTGRFNEVAGIPDEEEAGENELQSEQTDESQPLR
ncbi:MAG: hypothetical protein GKR91_04500 [Pseudomonadales bacterium]|nr:hypothetical protein [Pseudomonadales bacterium]